jgi:hypothetical protein
MKIARWAQTQNKVTLTSVGHVPPRQNNQFQVPFRGPTAA